MKKRFNIEIEVEFDEKDEEFYLGDSLVKENLELLLKNASEDENCITKIKISGGTVSE